MHQTTLLAFMMTDKDFFKLDFITVSNHTACDCIWMLQFIALVQGNVFLAPTCIQHDCKVHLTWIPNSICSFSQLQSKKRQSCHAKRTPYLCPFFNYYTIVFRYQLCVLWAVFWGFRWPFINKYRHTKMTGTKETGIKRRICIVGLYCSRPSSSHRCFVFQRVFSWQSTSGNWYGPRT